MNTLTTACAAGCLWALDYISLPAPLAIILALVLWYLLAKSVSRMLVHE